LDILIRWESEWARPALMSKCCTFEAQISGMNTNNTGNEILRRSCFLFEKISGLHFGNDL
jgi:hypothetical protein